MLRPSAEMRATADYLRLKSAHIFKYYGLENVGVGQIGIRFTFSAGRCTENIIIIVIIIIIIIRCLGQFCAR